MSWKELYCSIFGHNWTEYGEKKDMDTGRIIRKTKTCDRCGLSDIDNSGGYELFIERFGTPQAEQALSQKHR